jgi:hypothetical protein
MKTKVLLAAIIAISTLALTLCIRVLAGKRHHQEAGQQADIAGFKKHQVVIRGDFNAWRNGAVECHGPTNDDIDHGRGLFSTCFDGTVTAYDVKGPRAMLPWKSFDEGCDNTHEICVYWQPNNRAYAIKRPKGLSTRRLECAGEYVEDGLGSELFYKTEEHGLETVCDTMGSPIDAREREKLHTRYRLRGKSE